MVSVRPTKCTFGPFCQCKHRVAGSKTKGHLWEEFLECQLQPKRETQICVHRIQLLSNPGSTPANVTHQLMLCGGRGMGWVCMIVALHIVQSQSTGSTQNTSVGWGTPAVLMFTRYDYTGNDFTRYDYTGGNNPVVHAHHQSCCW